MSDDIESLVDQSDSIRGLFLIADLANDCLEGIDKKGRGLFKARERGFVDGFEVTALGRAYLKEARERISQASGHKIAKRDSDLPQPPPSPPAERMPRLIQKRKRRGR